jgi:hypothetical protein
LWHLTIFFIFSHLSNTPFCWRQWPKSGDFVWLTAFQYYLLGMNWKHPNH